MWRIRLYLLIFSVAGLAAKVPSKFKTLQCYAVSKDDGEFKVCEIKAINRHKSIINVKYLLKKMVDDLEVQLVFMKRANGWHPFLYNIRIDACQFLKKQNNLIVGIAYSYLKPYTSLNHSCPYMPNEVLIAQKLGYDMEEVRKRFPIETGEYGLHINWFVHKRTQMRLNIHDRQSIDTEIYSSIKQLLPKLEIMNPNLDCIHF